MSDTMIGTGGASLRCECGVILLGIYVIGAWVSECLGAVRCVICDDPHLKTRFAKHVYEKSLNMFCKQCFAKQHVI